MLRQASRKIIEKQALDSMMLWACCTWNMFEDSLVLLLSEATMVLVRGRNLNASCTSISDCKRRMSTAFTNGIIRAIHSLVVDNRCIM